jgi:putative acetyltransferase
MVTLFYETVHSVNKKDYTREQLDAWAPKEEEALKLNTWKDSLSRNLTYVAEIKGEIVGFSDMTQEGYLDRLFIHKDFQRQGIAAALVNTLEVEARRLGLIEIETEASITAKPFFERVGYRVVQPQVIQRKGVQLINFRMVKVLL